MSEMPSSNELLTRAKAVVNHHGHIVYPSRVAAQRVRDVVADLIKEIEASDLQELRQCYTRTGLEAFIAKNFPDSRLCGAVETSSKPVAWRHLVDSPYELHPRWHYTEDAPTEEPERFEALYTAPVQKEPEQLYRLRPLCRCLPLPEPPADDCPIHGESQEKASAPSSVLDPAQWQVDSCSRGALYRHLPCGESYAMPPWGQQDARADHAKEGCKSENGSVAREEK